MWKLLILVAISANTRFVASGSSSSTSKSSSKSSSSSGHSKSFSESSSYSSSETEESDACNNDDNGNPHTKPVCGKHEVFSNCTNTGCDASTCKELGFPVPCVRLDPAFCKKGCVCEEGYVRDDNGNCIPKCQCPSCGGDKNAVSGCGVNCNKHCSDIGQDPKPCITLCKINSCDCRDGYYLNDERKCVKPDKCNTNPVCGKNEVFSNCTNGGCDARNCSQLCFPVPCVNLNPADCKKGCICEEGYLRDDNGICIPKSECHKCGANETYVDCPDYECRPRTCTEVGFPVPCPAQAKDRRCPGKPGCVCNPGFVRNKKGVCIPDTDCPSCGGDKNARPGCGVNCNKHCSDIGEEPKACILICYPNACDCKDGFYLNSKGKCVKPDKCDTKPVCGKHEVFSNCTNTGCDASTCKELGFPVPCVRLDPAFCKKGCVCEEGYVRDDNGNCIPKHQCPSCGGDKNAVSGCGVNCNKHCSDIGQGPKPCIKICNINGCDCKDGYYLNDDGKCVKPDKCNTNPVCGKHEVFSNCTNGGCDARNCSQLGFPVPCVKLDPAACKKGCICDDGYLRDDNGICIPKSKCPSCGGDKNAVSGCGVNCNKHCSDIGDEPKACIDICYENACDCKDGFYLNKDGKCVEPCQCEKTPVCGKHEVFSNCTNGGCDARNCSQLGFPVPCVKLNPAACKKGCICDEGYLRDDNGICIPKSKCPSCGGDKNAVSGCGVNCNKHCSDIGDEPKACIEICYENACDCKDGFYLNKDGKCVEPCQCEKTPVCGKHEVFSNCTNGGCDARNCSQLGFPVPCVKLNPAACKKGCICDEGYLRDDNGICIPKSKCPSCGGDKNAVSGCGVNCNKHCSDIGDEPKSCIDICYENACDCKDGFYLNKDGKCVEPCQCDKTPICGKHEVFSNCTNGGCDARNCSQLGFPVPCVKLNPAACKKGCICEEGYLRADNGKCIPKSKCPSCGGDPNAKPGCGVHCGNTCATYKSKPVACPKICKVNGCDCKTNYVYDTNTKKCVLPKDCKPTCADNEEFSNCTNAAAPCMVRNCSQVGFPIPISCPKMDPAKCKTGCICKSGYLRANNGTCIPRNDCPSCGGDPNAKPGCGVHCGNTCATYKSKPVACPKICRLNSCDCKAKYVYDTNTKKCVRPKDCTPTCKINEVYSSCVNGGCDARHCSQHGKKVPCVRPKSCIKGCICTKGYLRSCNGTCIPEDQCCQTTPPTNTTDDSTGYCKDEDPQNCLAAGNIDFTLDFLHQMIKTNSGKSIVMSPFSVLFPLAQLALASDPGQSYKQLMSALNLNTRDQIRKVFPSLISSIQAQKEVILDLAAKTYVSNNAVLNKTFENDSVEVFKSKSESIDFADSEKAADTINDWVEEVTKGLIQNLVSPSMFSEYTRIALVNAIYFLGNWQTQFNPNFTNTQDFYITKDKTIAVQMMYRKGSFKYAESTSLDAKILQIPYKGGNFSYLLVLPNQVDGYTLVAEKIKDSNVLKKALDSLSYNTCQLSLPRHKITTTVDLTDILQQLNITDIFNSSLSGLNGILDNGEKLSVSKGIQKAAIEVTEVGTEAAAANAIIVGTTSAQLDQIVVKADHTFLFLLLLNRDPLFCGVYAGH